MAEMKDVRMYSTLEGAKKFAKNLKSPLEGSGIIFPLNRCQTATAVAGGFRDWHDLSHSLKDSDRPVDPKTFSRRLVEALPQPCWIPVFLWLDEGHHPEKGNDGLTHNYYRAVAPYVFSSSVIHRSKSALLRPGSGPGQRLRESLVVCADPKIKESWPCLPGIPSPRCAPPLAQLSRMKLQQS